MSLTSNQDLTPYSLLTIKSFTCDGSLLYILVLRSITVRFAASVIMLYRGVDYHTRYSESVTRDRKHVILISSLDKIAAASSSVVSYPFFHSVAQRTISSMARLFEDCFRNPFYSKIWLFLSLLAFFAIRQTSSLIATHNHHQQSDRISRSKLQLPQTGSGFSWQIYSDWSGFGTVDDEEESVDNQEYAREEDSFEKKAKLGSMIPPPTIEMNADPIFVPTGTCKNSSTLVLEA